MRANIYASFTETLILSTFWALESEGKLISANEHLCKLLRTQNAMRQTSSVHSRIRVDYHNISICEKI
jgi:hypothetical protein